MYLWGTQFTPSGPVMQGFCPSLTTAPVPISSPPPPLPISPQPPTLQLPVHSTLRAVLSDFAPIPSSLLSNPPLSSSTQREKGHTFLPHGSAGFTSIVWTLAHPPASASLLFPVSPPSRGSLEGEAAAAPPKDGASGSVLTWIVNATSALLCRLLKGGRRVGWAQ